MVAAKPPNKYSKINKKDVTLSKARVKLVTHKNSPKKKLAGCAKILPATDSTRFLGSQLQFMNSTFEEDSPFLSTSQRASSVIKSLEWLQSNLSTNLVISQSSGRRVSTLDSIPEEITVSIASKIPDG